MPLNILMPFRYLDAINCSNIVMVKGGRSDLFAYKNGVYDWLFFQNELSMYKYMAFFGSYAFILWTMRFLV